MCDREDKTTNNNIYHGSIVKAFIECLEVELVVRLVSDTDGTDDAKLCRRSTSGQSGGAPPAHNRNVTSHPPQLMVYSVFITNKHTEPSS